MNPEANAPLAGAPGSDGLPQWVDRISFRHGAPGEIILRVPGWDEFGEPMATNHVITLRLAMRLAAELVVALETQSPNAPASATGENQKGHNHE